MDGGAWQAAVLGVTKSRTRLSGFPLHFRCRLSGGFSVIMHVSMPLPVSSCGQDSVLRWR